MPALDSACHVTASRRGSALGTACHARLEPSSHQVEKQDARVAETAGPPAHRDVADAGFVRGAVQVRTLLMVQRECLGQVSKILTSAARLERWFFVNDQIAKNENGAVGPVGRHCCEQPVGGHRWERPEEGPEGGRGAPSSVLASSTPHCKEAVAAERERETSERARPPVLWTSLSRLVA